VEEIRENKTVVCPEMAGTNTVSSSNDERAWPYQGTLSAEQFKLPTHFFPTLVSIT